MGTGSECLVCTPDLCTFPVRRPRVKNQTDSTFRKELQSLGVQPDILVLRTEHDLNTNLRKKVALFCNVAENAVVQSIDASTIYEVPLLMQEQGLDETILQKMGLPVGERPPLGPWKDFLNRRANATETVTIAMVGKYVELQDAYKSILESLSQAATYNDRKVKIEYVSSEHLTPDNVDEQLGHVNGSSYLSGIRFTRYRR